MHTAERDLLVIRDKPGRHEKVEELVSKIVEESKGSHSMVQSLRGLVNFSRSQCFGRCSAVAFEYDLKTPLFELSHVLKPADIDALLFWPRFLQTSRPREIRVRDSRPPVIIMIEWVRGGVCGSRGSLVRSSECEEGVLWRSSDGYRSRQVKGC